MMARPTTRRGAAALTGLGLLLTPAEAFACSVCYGGTEGSLLAYLVTGVLMSLLPFGMIAAIGLWYLRSTRSRRAAREDI
jgi:hypothetical protein